MSRRSVLAALGSAGLGLWAMRMSGIEAGELMSDDLTKVLPKFNDRSRGLLKRIMDAPGFGGSIAAADVKALCESETTTVDALMVGLLPLARSYARPPISNFLVGVVARGLSGNLYLGANLEVPGQSLGFSVHGEQSVIANAYMHSDEGVAALAGTEAPCGHCRQFMNELSPSRDLPILIEGSAPTKLSALLPDSFGPKDLGGTGAFPVKETRLVAPPSADASTTAAFEAACRSYAPYSKSPSGVAVKTRSGRTYKGSYIENAAFNPSLSPLQVALVALVAAGGSYSDILQVTLVEVEHSVISQRSVTEAALNAIAPSVRLHVAAARNP